MAKSSAILVLLGTLSFCPALAGTPVVGTTIALSATGSDGRHVLEVFQEGATCPQLLGIYNVPVNPISVIPIKMANAAGEWRIAVLGTAPSTSQNQVWVGSGITGLNIPIADPVSIAPYSDVEAVVGTRNGDAFLVDGNGNIVETLMLENLFEARFPRELIGDSVRVWRSGPDSLSYLTQNHFVHSASARTTTLVLNETKPIASKAFLASWDLTRIRTGIGDDKLVWIVHETMADRPLSASLFEIETGKFVVRHCFPNSLPKTQPVPGYFNSETGTAYFTVGEEWISLTPTDIQQELPHQQLTNRSLPMAFGGFLQEVLIAPPAQGAPWGNINNQWFNHQASLRSTEGSRSVGLSTPISYNPRVIYSQRTPNKMSSSTRKPDPNLKKKVLGANHTQEQFAVYLRRVLGQAAGPSGEITSNSMAEIVPSLPFQLQMAILNLDDDLYLKPQGLKYSGGALVVVDATKVSTVAEWARVLWDATPVE